MTTRRCNIDVDAKVGIGVLSQEAPGRACPPAPIQSRLGPGHRVLVAEDDGLTALAVVDTLTALGAERIELCSRADEALELIAQLRPTVLILDLGLADRSDGWTVAVGCGNSSRVCHALIAANPILRAWTFITETLRSRTG